MINWKVSKEDAELIRQIAERARAKRPATEPNVLTGTVMDITACHANGCPLELAELLAADNFEFCHDVFGIRNHINRETGQLEGCFLPRFAKRDGSSYSWKRMTQPHSGS